MKGTSQERDFLKSLTVLLVEDEEFSHEISGEFLSRLVGVLVTAQNGAEGLEAWRQHKPDIIITDIRMPVMDGLAMLQEIRSIDRAVPVIILSAFEELEYLKRSIDLGVSGYAFKPVNVSSFTEVILKCAHGLLVEAKLVQARTDLSKQEQFTKATLDGLTANICVIDANGMIINTNNAWNTYAVENNAVQGTYGEGVNYLEVCHAVVEKEKYDVESVVAGINAVLDGSLPDFLMEYSCDLPDTRHWFIVRANRISVAGETYAVISHENITAIKKAEINVEAANKMLQTVLDTVPVRIFWKDAKLRFLGCNRAFAADSGAGCPEDLIGKDDFQMVWKEQAELYRADDLSVMVSGIPQLAYEELQTTQYGDQIWLRTSKVPLRNEADAIMGVLGTYEDITGHKKTENELRNSEERYRAIVESQTEFVDRFLPGGILTYVNSAITTWVGMKAEKLIGKSFYPFIHEDDIDEVVGKIEALTAEASACSWEYRIVAPDGTLHWHQSTFHALTDEQGHIIEYQGVGRDINEKKEAELFLAKAKETLELEVLARTADLEHANEEMKKVSFELVWAEERERERIAAELHDQVGQSLLLVKMKLDALAYGLSSDKFRSSAEKAAALIGTSIQDIRSLTFKLRPPLLETSNIELTMKWLCSSINEDYNISINFTGTDTKMNLAAELHNTLYRVVRELLLNVVKHAKTTHAELSLHTDDRNLTLRVIDQGVGFSYLGAVNNHATVGGYGLVSVRQRIEWLGGTLAVESVPDRGTVVTVLVPLQQTATMTGEVMSWPST